MSKKLFSIVENVSNSELYKAAKSEAKQSTRVSNKDDGKTVSSRGQLLQSMSTLEPILSFDSEADADPSVSTGYFDFPCQQPESSSDLSVDSDGDLTPTPEIFESLESARNLNIQKLLTSFKSKKNVVGVKNINHYTAIQSQAPSYLLIESLAWFICSSLEKDQVRKKQLFMALCQFLSNCNFLGPSYLEESLQPFRDSISARFNDQIFKIQSFLNQGIDIPKNPSDFNSLFLDQNNLDSATFGRGIYGSNRFQEEFEEIEVISRGGFGVVKKARYRLDNGIYAVKEISFPLHAHENFLQVIKEVKLSANLEPHPNVITYKTAWIQNITIDAPRRKSRTRSFAQADIVEITGISSSSTIDDEDDEEDEEEDGSSDDDASILFESQRTTTTCHSGDSDDFVTFANSSRREEKIEEYNYETTSCDNSNLFCESDFPSTSTFVHSELAVQPVSKNFGRWVLGDGRSEKHQINAILYIQMELCGINLRKYLDVRNQRICSDKSLLSEPFDRIDVKLECEHYLQILNGVKYIHSKHMIHRDLKPQNILFTIDSQRVKICDFGLATLHCSTNFQNEIDETIGGIVGHTTGLGTSLYAAPEQKKSNSYDYRADMYSLGLILLELFYPAVTEMEKVRLIDKLKTDKELPEEMLSRWPKLCSLIFQLTNVDPEKRPKTIADVILLFREAFPNILLLRPNLSRKDFEVLIAENQELKAQLDEKSKIIQDLERRLTQL